MQKFALLALLAAAALPAQVSVTFTALSGSVAATGGPTHTIAAGTNLAPGLNLTSTGTSGSLGATTSLQIQPMVMASGGHGIAVQAASESPTGGISASTSLTCLVTIQSSTPRQVFLDLDGSGGHYQIGFGDVAMDIDNDGSVELPSLQAWYRYPLTVGPTPRTISFSLSAGVTFWSFGWGRARFDLRIVPGTCRAGQWGGPCSGPSNQLFCRESVFGGVDLTFTNTAYSNGDRHMIAVLGVQPLTPPFVLPTIGCLLFVDPLVYWYVPRPTFLGGTVHLDVPSAVLPLVGYVQGVEFVPSTSQFLSTQAQRIDCQ
jgi:hypothetical protein